MTTLVAAILLANSGPGVNNVKEVGPQAQHESVREVANMIGMPLYAPEKTARGYTMRTIEMAKISGSNENVQYAIRMRFINKNTSTAFDIYQTKSKSGTSAQTQMNTIMSKGYFEGSVSNHDTFVALTRGDNDLAFVGGLVSEPSAKELLNRLVLIRNK